MKHPAPMAKLSHIAVSIITFICAEKKREKKCQINLYLTQITTAYMCLKLIYADWSICTAVHRKPILAYLQIGK